MHHICIEVSFAHKPGLRAQFADFQVKDINAAMEQLKAQGVRCLSKEPRIGAHNKPVVFLHPKDCGGVLTELEQQ